LTLKGKGNTCWPYLNIGKQVFFDVEIFPDPFVKILPEIRN
jgi:hypothetical protein